METKFTKGEWSINEWTQPDDRISIGAVGTPLIAIVPSRDVSYNEQKANAKLIAAAPDLLEACEKALDTLENENIFGQVRLLIAVAIKKATE